MAERKAPTPKPVDAQKRVPPPAPPSRYCHHVPLSQPWLCCDREPGHPGDHRGYDAQRDEVLFWSAAEGCCLWTQRAYGKDLWQTECGQVHETDRLRRTCAYCHRTIEPLFKLFPSVYIAAPYPLKDQAIAIAEQLRARGHEITSSWLGDSQEDSHEAAELDLADVDRADVLLLLHHPDWAQKGTGGRHVEFGWALKGGKRIVVLGAGPGNVFHRLNHVEHIDDLGAFQ